MKDKRSNPKTVPLSRMSLADKMVLLRRQQRREALQELRRMGISIDRLQRQWRSLGSAGLALLELGLAAELRTRPVRRKPKHA